MKIGTKLTLGFVIVSSMTVLVMGLSMNLSSHIEKLRFTELPMEQHVGAMGESLWAALNAVDDHRHILDSSAVHSLDDEVANLEHHLREYSALTDTDEERQIIAAFDVQWAKVKALGGQVVDLTERKKQAEDMFFELVDQADDVIDVGIQDHFADDDPNVLAKERAVREVEVSIWEAIHAAQQYTGLSAHITRSGHSQQTFAELMEKQFEDVDEFWGKYSVLPLSDSERAAANSFEVLWAKAVTQGREIINLQDQSSNTHATLAREVDKTDEIIDDQIRAYVHRRVVQRDAAGKSTRLATLAIGLIAVLAATVTGIVVTRSVSRPIIRLREAAEQIAQGHLDCRVGLERRDEIGDVSKAFDHMVDELAASAERLQGEVAERTQAEESLRDSNSELAEINDRLEKVNIELKDFVYIASHDLREPLRKISSFGTMLQESLGERLDGDERENLEFMIDGAVRMTRMVEGLLTYSRLNTREQEWQPIDLKAMLDEMACLELAGMIEDSNATIDVAPDPAGVYGNADEIRQVLQNLINNAIKYHREDEAPRVLIQANRETNESVRVIVDDNGIGIPAEHKDNVFKMFRRLHGRSKYDGAGIGLAICRKVVDKHGGKIGIEANEQGGTRIWFTMPLADSKVELLPATANT